MVVVKDGDMVFRPLSSLWPHFREVHGRISKRGQMKAGLIKDRNGVQCLQYVQVTEDLPACVGIRIIKTMATLRSV
jgi:hypothetical protein